MHLALPAAEAAAWARKIATPPPSLRQKRGLGTGATAFVLGPPGSAELAAALRLSTQATAAGAAMLVAIVPHEAGLLAALRVHAHMPQGAPIRVIHGQGRTATFGEPPVRTRMRAAGFIDSKVTAVSATQTATRYARSD